jgi:hypothetical protein
MGKSQKLEILALLIQSMNLGSRKGAKIRVLKIKE